MILMDMTLHDGQVGLMLSLEPRYAGSHLQDDTIQHHSYGAGLTPGLPFLLQMPTDADGLTPSRFYA